MQQYYEAHRASYETPAQVHARHILFKLPPKVSAQDKAKIRQQAEEVLAKVKGLPVAPPALRQRLRENRR